MVNYRFRSAIWN